MDYIYGRETSENEKVVTLEVALKLEEDVRILKGEVQASHVELNKHRSFDKEFPLAMRVKGIVEHAKALEDLIKVSVKSPSQPQRQDSVLDQLRDMVSVANREGCYDAADFLRRTVEDIERKK